MQLRFKVDVPRIRLRTFKFENNNSGIHDRLMQEPSRENDRFTSTVNNANYAKRRRSELPVDLSFQKSGAPKQKKVITCSACQYYTGTVVTGHRAYTQRCAQKNNPNHIHKSEEASIARDTFRQQSQGSVSTFKALQNDTPMQVTDMSLLPQATLSSQRQETDDHEDFITSWATENEDSVESWAHLL